MTSGINELVIDQLLQDSFVALTHSATLNILLNCLPRSSWMNKLQQQQFTEPVNLNALAILAAFECHPYYQLWPFLTTLNCVVQDHFRPLQTTSEHF